MIGIEGTRAKATLPQVANDSPHAIDALCVLTVHGLQRPLKAVLPGRYRDRVDVVRHEAVGKDGQSGAARIRPEKIEIGLGVARREKHRFAMIAALGGVVRDAWKNDSG